MKATPDLASKQLDRVLGFFPRVDTKASFVFAMNTGMLALLAVNIHATDFCRWFVAIPAIFTVLLLGASLYFVYRCSFPHLAGGMASLVYFREIGRRAEAKFIEEFLAQTDEDHVRDLLGQAWRNSEILKIKFDSIKIAFVLTAIALLPWILFLGGAALVHSVGLVIK